MHPLRASRLEQVTVEGEQIQRLLRLAVQSLVEVFDDRGEGARETLDQLARQDILYESRNEFFTVEGGAAATGPGNPPGRVRVIIQPRDTGTAAPPASGEATTLKPAGQLAPPRENKP